jgi:peptidyl-prolyl cis-trans isomerase SurA
MNSNRRLRNLRASILVLAALIAAGCGRSPSGPAGGAGSTPAPAMEKTVVAMVAGQSIHYPAFQKYVEETTGGDELEADQADAIKSRLLDQFLEEQLLLREAVRLKVTVSDSEVDGYLGEIGVGGADGDSGPEGREAFRDQVRQSLVLQKVKDAAVLSKVQVTAGEVEDYFKRQPDLFRAPRALVLRQILMDDGGEAGRVRSALVSDPARFEALARDHSVAPDRGQARLYAEEELPVDLRDSLFALKPGEISPVLEHAQRFLVFQLVRFVEARDQDLDEVKRRIQMDLFREKSEQALQRYIADLKKATEVRVNRAILPFNYNGEYAN